MCVVRGVWFVACFAVRDGTCLRLFGCSWLWIVGCCWLLVVSGCSLRVALCLLFGDCRRLAVVVWCLL